MLDDVIQFLACPYCGVTLSREGGSLRCLDRHVFDIARQGYVSLLPAGSGGGGGDTAAMIQSRAKFLAAGHFEGVATELAAVASGVAEIAPAGCVIDVGAGTGYYLGAVLDRLTARAGLALDISKYALRRAARAHSRIGAVVCDAWRRLPVVDHAAVVVLNVFAPRNGSELHRILHPTGRLIVVTPTRDHLRELVTPLRLLAIDERKDERLSGKLSTYFDLAERHEHRVTLQLGRKDVAAVAGMGPSAWHTDTVALAESIGRLPDPMLTTLSVTLSIFQPSRCWSGHSS